MPGLDIQCYYYIIQPEQSENNNPALKKQLSVAKHVKSCAVFFCRLTQTHVLAVKVSWFINLINLQCHDVNCQSIHQTRAWFNTNFTIKYFLLLCTQLYYVENT